MRAPENPYKDLREITIPVKIRLFFTGSIWGTWIYRIIFPTLGFQKIIEAGNEKDIRELLAFLGDPCTSSCSDCKHWRYRLTCYKLEDWEKERDKK